MARTSMAWKTAALWLVAIFALALVLRVAFNVEPSYAEDAERYVYSGNDPYYHDRTVGHILETGESLVHDPAINYPHGGPNANPPIYDWTAAVLAGAMQAGGMEAAKATSLALNIMVAVWGAMAVFPVYMIGRELFSRAAGIWSAFLIAVAPPHIMRGVWGFADHDATAVFFIALAMAFLIKALKTMERREFVADWRHGDSVRTGLGQAFRANRVPLVWATLAGVAMAAVALVWKGYPYVLAIMAVGIFLQLLLDHVRNKDSSVVYAVYLVPLLLVILLPLAYYLQFPSFIATTIMASVYVLVGVLVVGLVLVPTRQLPSIIVFPALAVAAIVGVLLLRFVFTDMWSIVTSGLGYFEQTKLYSTIGEAQRPALGTIAANFGFFTFLLAFWTFWRVLRRGYKGDAAHLVMAVWAVVAMFMAFAASRFIMNAAPVFAVFGGVAIATLASKIGVGQRQMYGQKKPFSWKSAGAVTGIALLLVVPNLWIGVDAAMTPEFELENGLISRDPAAVNRFGAFGIDFSIKDNGWMDALGQLALRDTCRSNATAVCQLGDPDYQPLQDRPAQIAWWDYGHWTTNIGKHPTVADPFQNHYNIAGRFLASESEENATIWLTVLLIDGDWVADGPGFSPAVQDLLRDLDPSLGDERLGIADHAFASVKPHLSGEQTFRFYESVMDATGRSVEYFATDARMYPTSNNPGIFYAPVYLSDKNPEDFVTRSCVGQSGFTITLDEYEMVNNVSQRVARPTWTDAQGQQYALYSSGGSAQAVPLNDPGATPVECSHRVQTTDRFRQTMFAKGFGGLDADVQPAGQGLEHWRVVAQGIRDVTVPQEDGTTVTFHQRNVAILQYYRGVDVSGRVVDEAGNGIGALEVTFIDGQGGTHAVAISGPDGNFTVRAPFSVFNETGGDLRLVARENNVVIAESREHQFTFEQAQARETVADVVLRVPSVSLSGSVFRDTNANNTYQPGVDESIEGATVSIGGRSTTTGSDGGFSRSDLRAGQHRILITRDGYNTVNQTVRLAFDQDEQVRNFTMTYAPRPVTFNVTFDDAPQEGVVVRLTGAQNVNRTTDANGTVTVDLAVGQYTLTINETFGPDNETYLATRDFTVAFNQAPETITIDVRDEGEVQAAPDT